jgi:hypothetical protein
MTNGFRYLYTTPLLYQLCSSQSTSCESQSRLGPHDKRIPFPLKTFYTTPLSSPGPEGPLLSLAWAEGHAPRPRLGLRACPLSSLKLLRPS